MNDSQRIQKIDAFIEQNKDALLRDLKTLVCIPSVQSAPEPGAPFGADVRKALDTALDMARGFGPVSYTHLQNRMAQVMTPRPMPYTILPFRVKGLVT